MSKIVSNNISPRSGDTVTVNGNISVGGTLTYEDVTNVDSVGVITARSGIRATSAVVGGGVTVTGVGELVVSQSTQGQSATLFLGKGGSSKVFSVDSSGNTKIGSNLDSASTTNITLNTSGTATFEGKVDVNNELHVHRESTTASNALLALHSDIGGTKTRKSTIRADGSAEFSGTVSDSIGQLRRLGQNIQSSNYTLVAGDAGKHVRVDGAHTITVPDAVFSAGDMITIVANSSSNVPVTQGSNLTLYNASDGTTGNKTIAARTVATILFAEGGSGAKAYISGGGLS